MFEQPNMFEHIALKFVRLLDFFVCVFLLAFFPPLEKWTADVGT